MTPKAQKALLEQLSDPRYASPECFERAQFLWVESLGLFIASEGKNRVALFRSMRGENEVASHIPAQVQRASYPVSERLCIYRLSQIGEDDTHVAVLDGELAELITLNTIPS
ncbi:hypothetical protein M0D69_31530 [Caballeronia sp. SEWSISQ10-4 2]|uniref:hypothetical protein n=1 Tax=Caballeronia sp. SEWSISQ10-4 2 TaxID=2937438 RepID=UPI002655E651|nr:hypothetical protein [Caballeronia sp. SEWSISQ10-4 2]MDN7182472.1 hypothetical protein [Caballeronia sp. SEWSISQ10-4 2]